MFAQTGDAVGKHRPKRGRRGAHGPRNQQRPDQRPIEAVRAGRDEGERAGEAGDEVEHERAELVGVGHQAEQIDAGGDAEDGGHVDGQLLGADGTGGGIGVLQPLVGGFGAIQTLAQGLDVQAELHVLDAAGGLQPVQAGDLGDQVHDPILASHQLAQPGRRSALMLFPIRVREHGRSGDHGGAQDIDPRRQRHVEGRMDVGVPAPDHGVGELQLPHEAGARLEMLMPRDVRQRVVRAAHGTLEEDHAQRGLEDLLMIRVPVQGLAELGDGGVSVAHDVAVDLFPRDPLGGLEMDGGDAETAVQIALVGFERGHDHLRPGRAVLIDFEDGENEPEHVVDEVVQQRAVAVIDLDERVRGGRHRAVGEVEEVEIHALFGAERIGPRVEILVDPCLLEKGQHGREGRGRLKGAKGRHGGIAARGDVVDVHLPFRLDVDFVGGGPGLIGGGGVVRRRLRVQRVGIERVVDVRRGEVISHGILGIHRRRAGVGGDVGVGGGCGQGVRQAGGGLGAGGSHLGGFLGQLGALDDVLDRLLLLLALVIVAPPHRPLVLALEPQMLAGLALALPFVTLLSSQPTCEAAYDDPRVLVGCGDGLGFADVARDSPDRDLRCILVVVLVAGEDLGAAMAVD